MWRETGADGPTSFVHGGNVLPKFDTKKAIFRAVGISLLALVSAEILVAMVHQILAIESARIDFVVTAIVTISVALPITLFFSIQRFRLQQAYAQLSITSRYDRLSGLFNRTTFEEQTQLALSDNDVSNSELTLLYLDADRFKNINDVHGHAMGDRAISLIGEVLGSCVRAEDFAGRMGGEEFCVILSEHTSNSAEQIAKKGFKNDLSKESLA